MRPLLLGCRPRVQRAQLLVLLGLLCSASLARAQDDPRAAAPPDDAAVPAPSAAPGDLLDLDVGLAVTSNFSPSVVFSQRAGPRLTLGLSGQPLGPVRVGARLGLQYDVALHQTLDLQGQVFAHRRFGFVEPSLGVGVNAFLAAGHGALVFASFGVAVRPVEAVAIFVEVGPGLLADSFGTAPWLIGAAGIRVHIPVLPALR